MLAIIRAAGPLQWLLEQTLVTFWLILITYAGICGRDLDLCKSPSLKLLYESIG